MFAFGHLGRSPVTRCRESVKLEAVLRFGRTRTSAVSNVERSNSVGMDPLEKILQKSTHFGRDISHGSTRSTVSGSTIIDERDLNLMECSWSSWAEDDPSPASPPTRRTHEVFNQALDKFLKQVDRKPKRFEQMVGIYRKRAGFDEDEMMEIVSV
eukprot:s55_g18.t1